MRRLLITGSRTWTDRETMRNALLCWFDEDMTLISGHCPDGADRMAEELWARFLHMSVMDAILTERIEIHPADWQLHGKAAGFRRNAEMVARNPFACLAFACWCEKEECKPHFPPHYTHGTQHCMDRAHGAGIPVHEFIQGSEWK